MGNDRENSQINDEDGNEINEEEDQSNENMEEAEINDGSEEMHQITEVDPSTSEKQQNDIVDKPKPNQVANTLSPKVDDQNLVLTHEELLEENKQLKQELEDKELEIRNVENQNLMYKDIEIRRDEDKEKLLAELNELKNIVIPQLEDDKVHADEESEEKINKLKKKLLQEKKRNEKFVEDMDAIKSNYEEQCSKLEEKLNTQSMEYMSQYNQLQSEKRKLEIKCDNLEIEKARGHESQDSSHKMGDNKSAHYEMMKKDMQKLIEFKNELEVLVEQQNTELERKNQDFGLMQKEFKNKDKQISHMNEYIGELEKQIKGQEHLLLKKETKFKQLKQDKMVEATKRIRDQQNEIDLLKQMISGSKKEIKAKVHNISTLKKRVGSLEKINHLHLSKHSDIGSLVSKDHLKAKNPFTRFEDDERYSSLEKGMVYNAYETSPINEETPDLEETGRYKKDATAHFGKTLDAKRPPNISSEPE